MKRAATTLKPVYLLLLLFSLPVPTVHSQGCSQCRETIGQSNPQRQQAYRRGILILIVAGGAVFTGTVVVLRRFR